MTALAASTLLIEVLRWVGLALFTCVLWRLWRPTRRAIGRSPQLVDPLWAIIWALILLQAAYQGTRLIVPAPPVTLAEAGWRVLLQILTNAVAITVLWLKGRNKAPNHG